MLRKRHDTAAGGYAAGRYARGLRRWRRHAGWRVLLCLSPVVLASLYIGYTDPSWKQWIAGSFFGSAMTMWMWFWDTPPEYVENWNLGAESERRTAKQLERLPTGWRVEHDVQAAYGNYDHIVVGPAGVFLLETKQPRGTIEMRDGIPVLRRRHDPEAAAWLRTLEPRAIAGAVRLREDVQRATQTRVWVHAVIVFWCDFPQGLHEADDCIYIHGSRLTEWLSQQPSAFGAQTVDRLADAVTSISTRPGGQHNRTASARVA